MPRTRGLFAAALALSLVIHLFGGAIWANMSHAVLAALHRLPQQHKLDNDVATSDTITLEKRNVPRQAQLSRAQQPSHAVVPRPPQPHIAAAPPQHVAVVTPVRPTPVPTAHPQRDEEHHVVARAPKQVVKPKAALTPARVALVTPPPAHVEKPLTSAASHAATQPSHAYLSPQELAQLNARFARTIRSSRTDLATIQKQSESPDAINRMRLQFTGVQGVSHGQGYITPTTPPQRVGDVVWYYTRYTYMYPDGHIESGSFPWPFRYRVDRDLFAMHVTKIPIQLPPPGYHVEGPLKPFVARFLQQAGYQIG